MKETVLFIHSVGTSRQLWAGVSSESIGGREAICPANIGYPPQALVPRGQTVTAADEAAHLLRSLTNESDPVHIVAHSYGATVALVLAEHPEFRKRLASMVLAEPVLFGSLIADHDGSIGAAEPATVASAREFAKNPVFSKDETGGGPEWLEVFIDYWNRPGTWLRMPQASKQETLAIGWKMYQEVKACFAADKPFRDYVLDVPTTLVMGARTTVHSRAMTQSLARTHAVRLVELAGVSHMAPLTHPAMLQSVIAEHFAALGQETTNQGTSEKQ
ncbi:MAG TPA: alpha/beta hydrolase [Polyangium sp.]|nr:alpha/beta hydrolase [Polyangium sp.]